MNLCRAFCSGNTRKDDQLTHVGKSGKVKMVNVGDKDSSSRNASARATVNLGRKAFTLVAENKLKKGDVLVVAQIAGIMAAKRCHELIPLCHPLALNCIDIKLSLHEETWAVVIESHVATHGKTGVEMEALTAASVAALTVYDMCKAVTHDVVISDLKLMSKTGGTRGDFHRSDEE